MSEKQVTASSYTQAQTQTLIGMCTWIQFHVDVRASVELNRTMKLAYFVFFLLKHQCLSLHLLWIE